MTAADETMFPISEGELHRIESPFIQQGIELETFARIRARGPIEDALQKKVLVSCGVSDCKDPCLHQKPHEKTAWCKSSTFEGETCPGCTTLQEQHDAEVAARVTAQLTAQHEQELRDAVEGARRGERISMGAKLCSFLHYSHSENERLAAESKGKAREILKGRMFEDTQILEALEELQTTGNIKITSFDSTGSNPGEQEQRAELPSPMPEGGKDTMK